LLCAQPKSIAFLTVPAPAVELKAPDYNRHTEFSNLGRPISIIQASLEMRFLFV
jgi:hypothetical protein